MAYLQSQPVVLIPRQSVGQGSHSSTTHITDLRRDQAFGPGGKVAMVLLDIQEDIECYRKEDWTCIEQRGMILKREKTLMDQLGSLDKQLLAIRQQQMASPVWSKVLSQRKDFVLQEEKRVEQRLYNLEDSRHCVAHRGIHSTRARIRLEHRKDRLREEMYTFPHGVYRPQDNIPLR